MGGTEGSVSQLAKLLLVAIFKPRQSSQIFLPCISPGWAEGRDPINAAKEAQGRRASVCPRQSAGMCLCTSQAAGLSLVHADKQILLVGDLRLSSKCCEDSWGHGMLCGAQGHMQKKPQLLHCEVWRRNSEEMRLH